MGMNLSSSSFSLLLCSRSLYILPGAEDGRFSKTCSSSPVNRLKLVGLIFTYDPAEPEVKVNFNLAFFRNG